MIVSVLVWSTVSPLRWRGPALCAGRGLGAGAFVCFATGDRRGAAGTQRRRPGHLEVPSSSRGFDGHVGGPLACCGPRRPSQEGTKVLSSVTKREPPRSPRALPNPPRRSRTHLCAFIQHKAQRTQRTAAWKKASGASGEQPGQTSASASPGPRRARVASLPRCGNLWRDATAAVPT